MIRRSKKRACFPGAGGAEMMDFQGFRVNIRLFLPEFWPQWERFWGKGHTSAGHRSKRWRTPSPGARAPASRWAAPTEPMR